MVLWYKNHIPKKYPSASYNRRKTFNLYQQTDPAQQTKNIPANIKKREAKLFYIPSKNKLEKIILWQTNSSIIQIIPTFQRQICSALSFKGKVFCLFCNVFFSCL